MELSYSQNLEDYHLSLAFRGTDHWGPISMSAQGIRLPTNVSFWFYERGWHGIVVEPQPELAALYQRLRPRDLAVRDLVGRPLRPKSTSMWSNVCHGLSTTVEYLAQKAKSLWRRLSDRSHACDHAGKIMRKARSGLYRLPQNRRRGRRRRCSVRRRLEALSTQGHRHRSGDAPWR